MVKFLSNKITTLVVRGALLLVCTAIVCACGFLGKERGRNVVAECCGQTLTVEDIAQLTKGYSGADSARIAEEYIQDWAVELLMYETSHRVSNRKIEELVADYRRSLYMHEYEQLLVAQRMPLMIEDTLISAFYETHRQQLILREMILKGALVVVPNGAPNMGDLRKHLGKLDDSESLEWIEKYVYQYGVGYELFVEDWKLCEEVLDCMPLEKTELSKLVRKNKQVELQDSINTYMLEVVDYYPAGGVMPLDYARKDIEMNILRTRRTEFLDSMRNELYDKSIKNGKLKRYEK
jgi:SpoVK/Ycf46/Vps4 family AAA+-type ATPase